MACGETEMMSNRELGKWTPKVRNCITKENRSISEWPVAEVEIRFHSIVCVCVAAAACRSERSLGCAAWPCACRKSTPLTSIASSSDVGCEHQQQNRGGKKIEEEGNRMEMTQWIFPRSRHSRWSDESFCVCKERWECWLLAAGRTKYPRPTPQYLARATRWRRSRLADFDS